MVALSISRDLRLLKDSLVPENSHGFVILSCFSTTLVVNPDRVVAGENDHE